MSLLALAFCSSCRRVSRPTRAFGPRLFAESEPFNCPSLGKLTVDSTLSCVGPDSVPDNLHIVRETSGRFGRGVGRETVASTHLRFLTSIGSS